MRAVTPVSIQILHMGCSFVVIMVMTMVFLPPLEGERVRGEWKPERKKKSNKQQEQEETVEIISFLATTWGHFFSSCMVELVDIPPLLFQ